MKNTIPEGPWYNPDVPAGIHDAIVDQIIDGTYGQQENPYARIVFQLPEFDHEIDAVLLSHQQHYDNLDETGREYLPKWGTILTTPESAAALGGNARALAQVAEIPTSTGRRHSCRREILDPISPLVYPLSRFGSS